MRGKLGDTVILCDGNAVEYTAVITGFGPETVEFSVEPGYPSAAEPSVEVTLFAGYPKQDKLEQVIRHGVELGCAHFVPFFSRYCVAAPKKEEQKNERYNRIAFDGRQAVRPGHSAGCGPAAAQLRRGRAAVWRVDLVLFCYRVRRCPLRELLANVRPADGKSRRSPSSPVPRAALPPRKPRWPLRPVPKQSASAPASSAARQPLWPFSPPS